MILRTFRLGLASLSFPHLIVLGILVVISGIIIGNPPYAWPFAYGLGLLLVILTVSFRSPTPGKCRKTKIRITPRALNTWILRINQPIILMTKTMCGRVSDHPIQRLKKA